MRLVLGALLAVFWVCGLGAQGWDGDQSSLPVPPTGASRQSEVSMGLFAGTPVEKLKTQSSKDEFGVTVSSRIVKKGRGDKLLWELRWEPGAPWGSGTWVAFRDGLGQLREARIILLEGTSGNDMKVGQPGTWIRLVPEGRGCRLDLFLAGRLVSGGWMVPASLVDILGSPDSWLWDQTSSDLDWGALVPQRRWEDEKVEDLRTQIHKLLSSVPEAPETLWWPDPQSGMTGTAENGSPWGTWTHFPGHDGDVSRGLGPWGVSLWVATGVLRGWQGRFPTWDSLMEPRLEMPGYSQAMTPDDPTESPAFAFDWIRNLGLGVYKTLYPNRPLSASSSDVAGLPFFEPVAGAGYAVEDLPALVHLLAVTKPGQIYLASRSAQKSGDKGGAAAVFFGNPAVLLPWVGNDNRVRVAVYAGPRELTLEQWLGTGPSTRKGLRPDHVALVALPLPPTVELPVLPAH